MNNLFHRLYDVYCQNQSPLLFLQLIEEKTFEYIFMDGLNWRKPFRALLGDWFLANFKRIEWNIHWRRKENFKFKWKLNRIRDPLRSVVDENFRTIINHIVTTYASLPLRVSSRRKCQTRSFVGDGFLVCETFLCSGNTLEKLFSLISSELGKKFDLNFCFAKRSFILFDELKHDKSHPMLECIVILNLSTWTRLSSFSF